MLGDHLYDIVRKDSKEPLTFYCINDMQESDLFSHLHKEVEKQTQDPNHPLNKSAKVILEFTYLIESAVFTPMDILYNEKAKKVSLKYINNYTSIQLSPESPPPSEDLLS